MGSGANYNNRVNYSRQLKQDEAAPYMDISYIDGDDWLLPNPSLSLNSIEINKQNKNSLELLKWMCTDVENIFFLFLWICIITLKRYKYLSYMVQTQIGQSRSLGYDEIIWIIVW